MRQPSEAEVLRAAMEAAVKTVMTSLPGKVVNYDPDTKLATVEPMVHNGNPIPPIPDVPVKWPRFGGYRLVGPLNAGDEVTIHFYKWDPSRFRVSGERAQSNVVRDAGLYAIAVPGSESEGDAYDGGGDGFLHIGQDDASIEIIVTPNQVRLGAVNASIGVAKGSVADNNFDAIKNWLTTHTHTFSGAVAGGGGGVASGTTATSATPAPTITDTESTKVFTI
jgi:hypothetical protein